MPGLVYNAEEPYQINIWRVHSTATSSCRMTSSQPYTQSKQDTSEIKVSKTFTCKGSTNAIRESKPPATRTFIRWVRTYHIVFHYRILASLSISLSPSLLSNIWLAERDTRAGRWQQPRRTLCLSQPAICVARQSVYAEACLQLNLKLHELAFGLSESTMPTVESTICLLWTQQCSTMQRVRCEVARPRHSFQLQYPHRMDCSQVPPRVAGVFGKREGIRCTG